MGGVVKCLLDLVLEKRQEDRDKLSPLLATFCAGEGGTSPSGAAAAAATAAAAAAGVGPLLSPSQASLGVLLFLDSLDEMVIDVPKACPYGAEIFAAMTRAGIVPLRMLATQLEGNNFASSYRLPEFIGLTLKHLCSPGQSSVEGNSSVEGGAAAAAGETREEMETRVRSACATSGLLQLLPGLIAAYLAPQQTPGRASRPSTTWASWSCR